ncbi:hypothetical protein K432DRAFT_428319 [Lepidopterella palustris CBS 459.81]|uniref:DUF6594 domain-containing protein n=1 Tax=Lepidopterella palustris CBS 459.81 TaxID=1314670 RepID=A0A8E2E429_9PEZI|nr:hypothetical protein K432DRAFT_428319 [Lepidopterella palustris CBS 459.81]
MSHSNPSSGDDSRLHAIDIHDFSSPNYIPKDQKALPVTPAVGLGAYQMRSMAAAADPRSPGHAQSSTLSWQTEWNDAVHCYLYDEYQFNGFEALHVLSIQEYQRDLCRIEHEIVLERGFNRDRPNQKTLDQIREILKKYCEAVADLETFLRRKKTFPEGAIQTQNHPAYAGRIARNQIPKFCVEQHGYELAPEQDMDWIRKILHKVLPNDWKYGFGESGEKELAAKSYENKITQQSGPEIVQREPKRRRTKYVQSKLVDRLASFIMALLAGAALLGPMMLMTFKPSRTARLITVSVAVVIFGLTISIATKATNQEILAAAASYAAVLVVYIGSAGPE